MKSFLKKDISSKKDLSLLMAELQKNWNRISKIKGIRKRSKEILMDRWLSDMKPTLHELSDKYGVRNLEIENSVLCFLAFVLL